MKTLPETVAVEEKSRLNMLPRMQQTVFIQVSLW